MTRVNSTDLADKLEGIRYRSRAIESTKPQRDRAERELEHVMRIHAKQIIEALRQQGQREGDAQR